MISFCHHSKEEGVLRPVWGRGAQGWNAGWARRCVLLAWILPPPCSAGILLWADLGAHGSAGIRGGFYTFDPDTTPVATFTRFFGTNNPYEALDAISAQFEAMTTAEKPKTGKNKVVGTGCAHAGISTLDYPLVGMHMRRAHSRTPIVLLDTQS